MANLETTDIFRGAFYLCMGGDLSAIRFRQNGRPRRGVATFLFNGQDLIEHDKAYVNGHALVNPVQFREALNHLRDILFEKLRRENGRYENDRERKDSVHQSHYRH